MTNPTESPMANAIDDVKAVTYLEKIRPMMAEAQSVVEPIVGGPEGESIIGYRLPTGWWLMLQAHIRNLIDASPSPSQHTGWSDEVFDWLQTELSAIDIRYRGDPAHDHDAWWLRDKVGELIESARKAFRSQLYGPHGWLNGHRALNEESWTVESDPLDNNEEYFAIPLYALVDPFKEIGKDGPPMRPRPSGGWSNETVEAAAKALYEEDDVWCIAFPWPNLDEGQTSADAYRRLARAALTAASSIAPATGFEPQHIDIAHDGFSGDVIGNYTTREGKRGFVVQQDGTRVVHVYGEKFAGISPSVVKESGETS